MILKARKFFWIFFSILLLIVLFHYGVNSVTEYELSKHTGLNIHIDSTSLLSIYKGNIELNNLVIYPKITDNNPEIAPVRIDKVLVNIDFYSLFKGIIEINDLTLDDLHIVYWQNGAADSLSNLVREINSSSQVDNIFIKKLAINNIIFYSNNAEINNYSISRIEYSDITLGGKNEHNHINNMLMQFENNVNSPVQMLLYPKLYQGDILEKYWDVSLFLTITTNLFDANQLGLLNMSDNNCDNDEIGAVNYSKDNNVMQIGLVNISEKTKSGVQFGFLNYMNNGFLPVFPIFNISVQ